MRYAIVETGIVVNVAVAESAQDVSWIASDNANVGDLYDSGTLSFSRPIKPVVTIQESRANRKSELSAIRFERETDGIVINGVNVETNRDSQAMINGAWSASQVDPNILIDWKGADGSWTQINAATITGIAMAVSAHVQACFSNERQLSEAIDDAETTAEVDAIDLTVGWPSV